MTPNRNGQAISHHVLYPQKYLVQSLWEVAFGICLALLVCIACVYYLG